MSFIRSLPALGAAAVVAAAGQSQAGLIRTGTIGELAASADFTIDGANLVVRLSNISSADVTIPAQVLTAVFFNIDGGAVSLTPLSAVLAEGSVVHFGPDGGGNLSGEWAYRSGLVGAPWGSSYGISSSGLGLFGPPDLFPGPNLEGPLSPDGLNYGITSMSDNISSGNAAVTGGFPLIRHEVVFTLSGLPADFDLERIGNVSFQYGTSLTEPNVPTFEIPAPGAASLLMIGGALSAGGRRRR
ncbi:MAG: hypothetical protein KF869_13710 [Phycisphaeraceae bacterium]|nr:hypothetical protein [Phycisphaeraceae bacterium]